MMNKSHSSNRPSKCAGCGSEDVSGSPFHDRAECDDCGGTSMHDPFGDVHFVPRATMRAAQSAMDDIATPFDEATR